VRLFSVGEYEFSRQTWQKKFLLELRCSMLAQVMDRRPDIKIEGIDVLIRPYTHIPVHLFDGEHIPFSEKTVDVVSFVDVLHHTSNARILLREAARVSRRYIVIKDHLREGPFAKATLQAMDWIGNYGHDVVLPYNYLSEQEWYEHFRDTNLSPERWTESLGLYPFPFSLVFGRRLHFIARLTISSPANAPFR
jgi:SAM-dependent methyltransferase